MTTPTDKTADKAHEQLDMVKVPRGTGDTVYPLWYRVALLRERVEAAEGHKPMARCHACRSTVLLPHRCWA